MVQDAQSISILVKCDKGWFNIVGTVCEMMEVSGVCGRARQFYQGGGLLSFFCTMWNGWGTGLTKHIKNLGQ